MLSAQRTNAAIDLLAQIGVAKEKMAGASCGETNPIVSVQEPELQNRRVKISLAPSSGCSPEDAIGREYVPSPVAK